MSTRMHRLTGRRARRSSRSLRVQSLFLELWSVYSEPILPPTLWDGIAGCQGGWDHIVGTVSKCQPRLCVHAGSRSSRETGTPQAQHRSGAQQ